MFDRVALVRAIAAYGPVARVVVAGVKGSAPREVGAAMLVWADAGKAGGQEGTIGGGALEYQAAQNARELLAQVQGMAGRAGLALSGGLAAGGGLAGGEGLALGGGARCESIVLGPNLGQCCGGAVTLVTEVFAAPPAEGAIFARAVSKDAGPMPLPVARALADARQGRAVAAGLHQGWMIEPLRAPLAPIWVWGAGHVGRAIVAVLAPLPDVQITWVDTELARFPMGVWAGVRVLPVPDLPRALAMAPLGAHHLIVTFSHALDLALCDGILRQGFASCGLIGSASKWARFRTRLAALGHSPADILRIRCPIGDPALGKHPHAIAIGVAAAMMPQMAATPRLPQEVRA